MAGLQRSMETFRRSGSSGLVWEERFSAELTHGNKTKGGGEEEGVESRELNRSNSVGLAATMQRSGSNGGGRTTFRTGKVTPSMDPPSPKVSACGFCTFFGKPAASSSSSSKRMKKARR